jgi:S1-C subfamily serine protease
MPCRVGKGMMEFGMAAPDWRIPPALQPQPGDYRYDLGLVLSSVVGIKATVPAGALTAETLGTERAGSGVFIAAGVVLTIGYLITEAETVWLSLAGGRVVPGTPLAYDQQTGFGLVQALAPVDVPLLSIGDSGAAWPGTRVVLGVAGGRHHSIAAVIVGKQEFAGYWEYVLDEAIFTAPAHPFWGGAALIGPAGDLLGIGSLQVGGRTEAGETSPLNMVVPIDLLKPILNDLLTTGRANRPLRPWLGLFAAEVDGRIFVAGLSTGGPADRAGLRPSDMVIAVAGTKVDDLAGFFRRIWSLGPAGVDVPLQIYRDGARMEVNVRSADRSQFLKSPRLH